MKTRNFPERFRTSVSTEWRSKKKILRFVFTVFNRKLGENAVALMGVWKNDRLSVEF